MKWNKINESSSTSTPLTADVARMLASNQAKSRDYQTHSMFKHIAEAALKGETSVEIDYEAGGNPNNLKRILERYGYMVEIERASQYEDSIIRISW